MWPILVEFRSATSEIRWRKKKERKKKKHWLNIIPPTYYVGRPNKTDMTGQHISFKCYFAEKSVHYTYIIHVAMFISPLPLERCRGHYVFRYVHPWISLWESGPECASQKPCGHHISKTMKEISPNFGHICIWFVDVLIRFWDQKVKVTARNDPKTLWTPYLTRGSTIAEEPRGALRQLKYYGRFWLSYWQEALLIQRNHRSTLSVEIM